TELPIYQKSAPRTPDGSFSYSYTLSDDEREAHAIWSNGTNYNIAFNYNEFGDLIKEDRPNLGGQSRDTEYLYDTMGNRTAIVWPDGWTARYVYDDMGRLYRVWADPNGNGTCASQPNACGDGFATYAGTGDYRLAQYEYDTLNRVTAIIFGGSTSNPVSRIDYTYDDDGDLASEAHTFSTSSNVTLTHTYDKSGKLISTQSSDPTWLYNPGVDQIVDYGAANTLDQYPSVNGEMLAYDANGNMRTAPSGAVYTHTSDNQLETASVSGTTTTYRYDARGRPVLKDVGGTKTHFIHAGDMEIAEMDNSGTITVRYVPGAGIDQRVAMVVGSTRHYYHPDRLGNVIAMVDNSGVVTDQYLYTPFGVQAPFAASGNPFRYTGQLGWGAGNVPTGRAGIAQKRPDWRGWVRRFAIEA
ncbi:MAG: hypothetical protein AAGJ32_10310, partial [Pseudomonadota bacterium]